MLGKGGKVALPSLARTALDQHLVQRGLPVTPTRWNPATPLVASLEAENPDGSGACCAGSSCWQPTRSRTNDRRPLRSCGARANTGCGTPTHRTRSGAALS
ncbi:hypothetical protein BCEP4_640064 [Burkholderia cepacia]|nr:hypothetical protein BCEP4_640064 [Burkholderia cepacia]